MTYPNGPDDHLPRRSTRCQPLPIPTPSEIPNLPPSIPQLHPNSQRKLPPFRPRILKECLFTEGRNAVFRLRALVGEGLKEEGLESAGWDGERGRDEGSQLG